MSRAQQALNTLYWRGADGEALVLLQEHAQRNGEAYAREAFIPDWVDASEDCLPDVWEANEPIAPLSGEWSGEPTHRSIAEVLGLPGPEGDPDDWQVVEDCIDEYYMHHFNNAFESAILKRLSQ